MLNTEEGFPGMCKNIGFLPFEKGELEKKPGCTYGLPSFCYGMMAD